MFGKQSLHYVDIDLIKRSDIIYMMNNDIVSDHLRKVANHINQNYSKPILWYNMPKDFKYDLVQIKKNKLILKRFDIMTSIFIVIIAIVVLTQMFSVKLADEIMKQDGIQILLIGSIFLSGIIATALKQDTIIRFAILQTYNNFVRLGQTPSFKVV
jgi:hypothetical protein